jgi:hypothetical protein
VLPLLIDFPSFPDTAPNHAGAFPWRVRCPFFRPGPYRLAVKIFAQVGGIDARQPRRRLVHPVLAHDGSTKGIPDFKGPALAHSSDPSAPFTAVTQGSRLQKPLALQPFVATLSDGFRVRPWPPRARLYFTQFRDGGAAGIVADSVRLWRAAGFGCAWPMKSFPRACQGRRGPIPGRWGHTRARLYSASPQLVGPQIYISELSAGV